MAMLKCHECGGGVSSDAKACPSCGAKVKKPTSKLAWLIAGLFAFVLYQCVASNNEADLKKTATPPKTPEQIAKEAAEMAENQIIQAKLRALKAATKNPDSFKLEQAIVLPDKTLCVAYRGANSFGAIVEEMKAIAADGTTANYAKLCHDKTGRSVRSLGP